MTPPSSSGCFRAPQLLRAGRPLSRLFSLTRTRVISGLLRGISQPVTRALAAIRIDATSAAGVIALDPGSG
jgi:hypothetical protein